MVRSGVSRLLRTVAFVVVSCLGAVLTTRWLHTTQLGAETGMKITRLVPERFWRDYHGLWPWLDGESSYDADLLLIFVVCWLLCSLLLAMLWKAGQLLRSEHT
jgi:hypothetical protein